MPAQKNTTSPDRSKEHKSVTDEEKLHPVDPHDKQRIAEQRRATEDVPEKTPIDDEELAGDEPLPEDL
ncbi:hypothetical protein [Chitinophaga qingshengii]|uniref:Uncharacterized protein n=1 Tax=Chitinophaga qingshengii TaxID=1569794 RepID=A0ABR7THA2_9BACT|nr:hypothetical protein [Chitinophaga qingshengii]MBC9929870.1 hypothetical protein [Chitinophaga qingshengii]